MFIGATSVDIYARGRSSGGSRSVSRSPSRTKSNSSWGSKSKSKSTSSWGSSSKSTPSKSKTSADKKLYERAKQNGKVYSNRSQAAAAMKKDPALQKKYTSKYDSKPETRPSHIPQNTKGSDGNTYNVTYNQQYGGYGYMNNLGAWIVYDALSDAAMYSMIASSNGYYAGPPPAAGFSGWIVLKVLVGIVAVAFIIILIVGVAR